MQFLSLKSVITVSFSFSLLSDAIDNSFILVLPFRYVFVSWSADPKVILVFGSEVDAHVPMSIVSHLVIDPNYISGESIVT